MLLAARNLTLLADVLPTICSAIVRHGAVPALCARLMTIEYIDLAEQSLQVINTLCLGQYPTCIPSSTAHFNSDTCHAANPLHNSAKEACDMTRAEVCIQLATVASWKHFSGRV